MIYPKGSRVNRKSREAISKFIDVTLKNKSGLGKGVKILTSLSQEEPNQPYIRLLKSSGREPWCQSDGIRKWFEYEITYTIDVRVPETDMRKPDNPQTKVQIKNYATGRTMVRDESDDIASDIVDILMESFELYEGRLLLSSLGIHNCTLKDERETYSQTEYQNPLSLKFNAYVYI